MTEEGRRLCPGRSPPTFVQLGKDEWTLFDMNGDNLSSFERPAVLHAPQNRLMREWQTCAMRPRMT